MPQPEASAGTSAGALPDLTSISETERKFRVHGLYRLPDLVAAGVVAGADDLGVATLDATYFDTDDLRLAREGITLRRRIGGDDAGWHVKLPVSSIGSARTREEIHLPLRDEDHGDGAVEVPSELRHLVGVLARADELRPVATLRTERHSFLLWPLEEDASLAGASLAEADTEGEGCLLYTSDAADDAMNV